MYVLLKFFSRFLLFFSRILILRKVAKLEIILKSGNNKDPKEEEEGYHSFLLPLSSHPLNSFFLEINKLINYYSLLYIIDYSFTFLQSIIFLNYESSTIILPNIRFSYYS